MPFPSRSAPRRAPPRPGHLRRPARAILAAAWALPALAGAQPPAAPPAGEPSAGSAPDGLYAGTLIETWSHPEARCTWPSPRPLLRIAEGRATLRFHEDPPWEATGPVGPGGRIRLEFGRGTEMDVAVVGAIEGTAFRGVLRTRTCAFALELVRR
ncbi:hypothetical protein [Caldovatus aquaticus]|uniref:Uncharacterized protein n=1 Tax=Caldovatus aquaticus TaxID=2865671 RepID=A0ABS7F6B5_9PROT|nr:hypothetical protein [Caldovatus aquaticus]MBW8271166.1 hypothetical protein [Caldovatus aquaticus]